MIEGENFFKEIYQVNINQSHRVMGTKEIDWNRIKKIKDPKKDKEAIVQEISFKGNVTEEALEGLHPSQRLLFLWAMET